jgi:stage II sporulation protein AA (anti-sigma F factor antagonist)
MAELATMSVERLGDVHVVRLVGEVDISNAAALEEDISDAVPNDATGLVLDLSDTRYLDSAGIRMLFELARRLDGRRQSLVLTVPGDSLIRHSLIVTEVEQAMGLENSQDDAVDHLGGAGQAVD